MSRTLRVALDVSAVPAQPVGAGRYTVDLVRALAAGSEVELVLVARRDDRARWAGLAGAEATVVAAAPAPRPARLAWEQLALPGLLRRHRVDVHHGPHYTMPERSPVPCVVTVHDLTFFDHPEWHQRTKVPVFRRAITVAARKATALVCVSDATAGRLRELHPPAGRIFVVPHGVDHSRFRPDEAAPGVDAEALAGLSVRPPYVLFLGTLEPRKAVPELIAAFDLIADDRPDLTLVLAGGLGWGADALHQALRQARHRDRILRTGYVPEDAVPALLRRAAAVAYPARQEGFGLPALEALACGAPLVTTAGTVMADVAQAAAVLAAPGSVTELAAAVRRALAADADAARRRHLGLQLAGRFTWAASAAGHVEAYRWAASGRRGSAVGTPDAGR